MKTYAVFLLVAISVVSGKFEFTEEWELWKKVQTFDSMTHAVMLGACSWQPALSNIIL